MFSLRSIKGSATIILADIIIGSLIMWLVLLCLHSSLLGWLLINRMYFLLLASLFTLTIVLSMGCVRLYSFSEDPLPTQLGERVIIAFFLASVFVLSWGFFVQVPRRIICGGLLALLPIYGCLYGFHFFVLYCRPENRKRILIMGANEKSRQIITALGRKRFTCYEVGGVVTFKNNVVDTDFHDVPVLGLLQDIEEIVASHNVDIVLVALREWRRKLPVQKLLRLKLKNIRILDSTTFYERIEYKILINNFLRPSWFIFERGFYDSSFDRTLRRAIGIIVSFFMLTFLSPVLLLVAILIKLESPGPIFYIQERIGLDEKIFRLIKFRSMIKDAEKMTGPVFAQKDDSRVTRVGKIIRRLRLDEIPQLINVFKGDMNLIGPRPERPSFVEEMRQLIPYYDLRHVIRPGITGWAQVKYGYGDTIEDGQKKLEYDLYYLKYHSTLTDLVIILITIKVILSGRGR